jgi:hypothetical protein
MPRFEDRGCHVVSVTDLYGRIFGFLGRSRYYFQVAPQLYSRGWVDPAPDPLLLRKSGSAGNRARTSGSVPRQVQFVVDKFALGKLSSNTSGVKVFNVHCTLLYTLYKHPLFDSHVCGAGDTQNILSARRDIPRPSKNWLNSLHPSRFFCSYSPNIHFRWIKLNPSGRVRAFVCAEQQKQEPLQTDS